MHNNLFIHRLSYVHGIAKRLASCILLLASGLLLLTSCSETEEESEFANWQSKNENFFKEVYANAVSRRASGDSSWMTLRKWSLKEDDSSFHADIDDNIVVHVLSESGSTSPSPLFTDTVRVVYEGRLIPSPSYPSGYVFQKTFEGEYNPATAVAVKLGVQEVRDGFATALQHMKVGEDFGLVAFNEQELNEILCNGLTTISTDFVQMGKTVVDLVKEKEIKTIRNPWRLILRNSL